MFKPVYKFSVKMYEISMSDFNLYGIGPSVMNNLYLVAYVSRAALGFEAHWHDIVNTATTMNPEHGITGVLFHNQGLILQVLEGEERLVKQLMDNICRDTRHTEIEIILDEPVKKRGFPDWAMDTFDLPDDYELEKKTLIQIGKDYKEIVVPRGDMFIKFYKATLGIDLK